MYYTYIYFTKVDASIPTYVGKGKQGRYKDHHKADTHFGRHVRKQLRDDIFPITVRIPAVSEQAAFDEEVRLIALYGRADLGKGSLYNVTDGGEGPSGRIFSDETKAKMSASQRAKPPVSEETKAKISASLKGKPRPWASCTPSPETVEKRRIANTGRPLSDEHKAKMSASKKGKPSALRGRTLSPETRAKLSEAARNRKGTKQ